MFQLGCLQERPGGTTVSQDLPRVLTSQECDSGDGADRVRSYRSCGPCGDYRFIFRGDSDDIAFAVDALGLDAPVLSQTTFDRTVTIDSGDYPGNYKAGVQWIAK
jgi:hypothetical protein